MLYYEKLYDANTKDVVSDFQQSAAAICDLSRQMKENALEDAPLKKYFERLFGKMELLYQESLSEDYFKATPIEQMSLFHQKFYGELEKQQYEQSFANPQYAVAAYGDKLGQALSYIYSKHFACLADLLNQKYFKLSEYNGFILDLFSRAKSNEIHLDLVLSKINKAEKAYLKRDAFYTLKERQDDSFSYYKDIVMESDLTDLRYLYRYGRYITENELQIARFIMSYPQDKLEILADTIVSSYINSFKRDNKSIANRKNVSIMYALGHELLIRKIILKLQAQGLTGRPHYILLSTSPSHQFEYDHKFDHALYYSKDYRDKAIEAYATAAEELKELLLSFSGVIAFRSFGETPHSPDSKPQNLKLSQEQTELYQEYTRELNKLYARYYIGDETSFTIIALPNPEIGNIYQEVFESMMEVNTKDNDLYEPLQQLIINTLDQAQYVHIKGRGTNQTDIKVQLAQLMNPDKETLFYNCVADTNIPAGEVFTSPKLTGTTGLLHCEDVFLRGYRYIDLRLEFKDGYVEQYSCSNYDAAAENKRYIEENMLFPHKTLPMGEFAIGTNTKAYMMAKKYNIVEKLPILVVEKMGPHFAIGDTCFRNEEDTPIYNLSDQKEMIARQNEKTALRKTDIDKAYTYTHMDITIPYESISFISAVTTDGQYIDIIRDGRFVLTGTELLNKPFEE